MNRADKLGLIIEQAQAHYLLGQLATVTGKEKQFGFQYRDTVKLLESVSKEPGVGHLLDRADLKGIYQDAVKSTRARPKHGFEANKEAPDVRGFCCCSKW